MLKKSLLILTAAVGLTITAKAQLGCTRDECEQRYANGKLMRASDADCYTFSVSRYLAVATFTNNRVSKVWYLVADRKNPKMYLEDAEDLLKDNAPEATWSEPSENDAKTDAYWSGYVNGEVLYSAHLEGTIALTIVKGADGIEGAVKTAGEDSLPLTILPKRKE